MSLYVRCLSSDSARLNLPAATYVKWTCLPRLEPGSVSAFLLSRLPACLPACLSCLSVGLCSAGPEEWRYCRLAHVSLHVDGWHVHCCITYWSFSFLIFFFFFCKCRLWFKMSMFHLLLLSLSLKVQENSFFHSLGFDLIITVSCCLFSWFHLLNGKWQ